MPGVEHRSHKGLNNRAEKSHVPLRKREQMMHGLPICRPSAMVHLDLFSGQKSFRAATSEALSPSHPHSSHPRDGGVESRNRRSGVSSRTKPLPLTSMKQGGVAVCLAEQIPFRRNQT
ncbi:hypothetical protein GGD46_004432 [Rhizobium lusitanum]|uniref:DDE domain-containing protein n=1 Tax=Rhizobium lusitanum TaxID=293958 RepID=A0A7X0MDQ2_9HYPH|nr:hypothetical protein [Rhizobium lusitanum]